MAVRAVLTWPDARLRQHSAPIEDPFDLAVKVLYDDLCATMVAADGIGIAAPQIGVFQQMFIVDVAAIDRALEGPPLCFINPAVERLGRIRTEVEGCLSFPGEQIRVPRTARVRVTAFDLAGKSFVVDGATGLYARCIQHEYEHLIGRLLEDYRIGAWTP